MTGCVLNKFKIPVFCQKQPHDGALLSIFKPAFRGRLLQGMSDTLSFFTFEMFFLFRFISPTVFVSLSPHRGSTEGHGPWSDAQGWAECAKIKRTTFLCRSPSQRQASVANNIV